MRRTITAAAVAAAFGVCAVASAQSDGLGRNNDLYPYGFTLRGGVAIPLDKSLTNVASALANIGVEFTLPNSLLRSGDTYISADYFFKGFGGSGGGTVLPLMINQRVYSSDAALRNYYFFGVGAVIMSVNGNGTALGARFGVGQELGPATIAEISALISDRAGNARANSITFNIGYRF